LLIQLLLVLTKRLGLGAARELRVTPVLLQKQDTAYPLIQLMPMHRKLDLLALLILVGQLLR